MVTHHAQMKFGVPVATLDIDAPVVPPGGDAENYQLV